MKEINDTSQVSFSHRGKDFDNHKLTVSDLYDVKNVNESKSRAKGGDYLSPK